ncbi:MAG: hypothetical protein WCR74_01660 [Betaproteobacteria bacterium]
MAQTPVIHETLTQDAARRLSTSTNTRPIWAGITPRYLLRLMPWVNVESGTYRVNNVLDPDFNEEGTASAKGQKHFSKMVHGEHGLHEQLSHTFADYSVEPHEYTLTALQTMLRISTKVADTFNVPHNQLKEQQRLLIEALKEEQEKRTINSKNFGLLHSKQAARMSTIGGPPTPDDFDAMLARLWKKPAFFLAHPRAIAAFGRECTARGVCIGTVEMFGSPFWTWRGVPIVPCDKLAITKGSTNVLLMRVGEEEQGVVGLHQTGIPGEVMPSVSILFNGIDSTGCYVYLVNLYFSVAVLTNDALVVMENVKVK